MKKIKDNWQNEISFNDFCNISSSKRIYYNEYVESGIPFYRSKEIIIKSQGKDFSECLYISKERFEEIKNKYGIPKSGDILLTAVGTYGIPYLVNQEDYFYFKDGNLIWLKDIKTDIVNSKFILYWLKSSIGKNKIENITIGSVQKALTIDALKRIKIKLPPLEEQKKIASILSSLDDKIELNNRMNKILEETAQTIFKEWFINFNFPNEKGKPYKDSGGRMIESELGEIPEGWEVSSLDNLLSKFTTGLNPRKNFKLGEGNNYYVTIKNMNDNQIYLDNRCDKINDDAIIKINKRSDLRKNDLLFSGIGTIGRVYLINKDVTNWNISESIFTMRVNDIITPEYLYLNLLDNRMQEYALNLASGSVQKGIRMGDLKKYKMIIPKKEILILSTKIFSSIIKKVNNNFDENQKLASIRDTLLPKLMKGEIRVK